MWKAKILPKRPIMLKVAHQAYNGQTKAIQNVRIKRLIELISI
jgi:hypothetical protein